MNSGGSLLLKSSKMTQCRTQTGRMGRRQIGRASLLLPGVASRNLLSPVGFVVIVFGLLRNGTADHPPRQSNDRGDGQHHQQPKQSNFAQ